MRRAGGGCQDSVCGFKSPRSCSSAGCWGHVCYCVHTVSSWIGTPSPQSLQDCIWRSCPQVVVSYSSLSFSVFVLYWGLGFHLIFLSDVVPYLFILGLTVGLGGWSPCPQSRGSCVVVGLPTLCPTNSGWAGISLRTLGLHEMILIN